MDPWTPRIDQEALAIAREGLDVSTDRLAAVARLALPEREARILALLLTLGFSPRRAELEEHELVDEDGVAVGLLAALLGDGPGVLSGLRELDRMGLIDGFAQPPWAAWQPKAARARPVRWLCLAHVGVAPEVTTDWYRFRHAEGGLDALVLAPETRAQLARMADGGERLLVLRGEAGAGRHAAAHAIASRRGSGVLVLTRAGLGGHFASALGLARWWRALVVVDGSDEDGVALAWRFAGAGVATALVVDLDAPRVEPPAGAGLASAVLHRPSEGLRAEVWRAAFDALGHPVEVDARRLARAYPLGFGDIFGAVREADERMRTEGAARLGWRHLRESLSQRYRRRRPFFVQSVPVRATLADVVLPAPCEADVAALRSLCLTYEGVLDDWNLSSRLSKGRGIVALLSGPPGTGKTLVAEALASDLGRELLKVDFGTLVSKYVGETGARIRELFEAVDPLGAVLLFDEVDSLLQRRTEARSSNDRYANLDTNLVLQHLELFDGIVLLTTNLDAHLDEALRRRISLHVRFSLPAADERERIWRNLVPAEVPLDDDVDFAALADGTELGGGHIKNCVVRALNAARARGEAPGMRHFHAALVTECRALGMVVRSRPEWED